MAARLMRVLGVLGYYTVFVLIIKCYSHFLEDFCLNRTHFLEEFEKWELFFTPGIASEAPGSGGNPRWAG